MTFDFDIELENAIVEVEQLNYALLKGQMALALHEAKSAIDAKHLRVSLLDHAKFTKANEIQEVTNPIIFQGGNVPTPDGLLSNSIFGITRYDRANTCAYIDLHEWFLQPHLYKVWTKLDKNIIAIVHGTTKFRIDKGKLVEDPEGDTGIRWLRKNYDKIDIARTTSQRRDENAKYVEYCQKHPNEAWCDRFLVLPAYYRDVDTSKGGKVSIGEINELYRNLIIAVKSLRETSDYGLSLGESVRGRIQQLMVQIFDWFGMGTTVNGSETGANLPSKLGIIRRSVMSKTTDYADRLVLSAPNLRYNKLEEAMVDMDHSAVPMSACISTFMPFVIFNVKRYFDNFLSGGKTIPILNKDGEQVDSIAVKDYLIQFSEERIKKEIDRFIAGYSNRFIPVEVEDINGKKHKLHLKGFHTTEKDFRRGINVANNHNQFHRYMTWCDVFYMATVEATKDKHIMVTRYPINFSRPIRQRIVTKLRELLGTLTETISSQALYGVKVQRLSERSRAKWLEVRSIPSG